MHPHKLFSLLKTDGPRNKNQHGFVIITCNGNPDTNINDIITIKLNTAFYYE
jgi:hypothetical protein